ncbi:2,3-dihydroxybenzoate-AMP ligase [Longimycelium tulufanense]|uniref:2,3-dihydroxybenzoate-AMP ligase n=1 Tax=Longimycelium tulufanense TaxID=907463 RepID=A0A8J3CA69_9PSEU|nr:(2,3-dihydroxybenzoyl)adenylate synthase [Longimycelium tulufanense]GGM49183.1 2,3-dihydroxybenzoate-AMP ligase [Longimycelium tulufanense]
MLFGCTAWPAEFAARYRQAGYWSGQTLGDMLRERAVTVTERIAVVDDEHRLSYGEFDARVDGLVAGFRELGVLPRDRVVVQLPNIAAFLEVLFALFRLGAVPVLALPSHRSSEIRYFCEHSAASAYVIADTDLGFDYRTLAAEVTAAVPSLRHVIVCGEPDRFTALEELRRPPGTAPGPAPGDVALLLLSGGSTGLPKLIPRTHDDYLYNVRASAQVCRLGPHSTYLAALPVAHNFPLSSPGILGTLDAGGKVVLARRPAPDTVLPLIHAEQVTITAAVPPLAGVWLGAAAASGHDLSSLKILQVGGATLSTSLAQRIEPTFGCTLQQVFGMAEGLLCYTRLDDPDELRLATQGRPVSPDDEIRIVDDADQPVAPGTPGHLLARGPYTIRGYYKAEQHNVTAFTTDGFYRTGDIVRLTPEGYLVVEGRAKDQINRGGDKIPAQEVENHLLAHPAVAEAAVVAIPDEYLGERSCAFIVPRGPAPTPAELLRFVRQRGLAAFKVPDRVEIVEALPKTGVGKVSKNDLRAAVRQDIPTDTQNASPQHQDAR